MDLNSEEEIIKAERWRIWEELYKILDIDDYGNVIQGDEVWKIVFDK
jgi:hypothetical protein